MGWGISVLKLVLLILTAEYGLWENVIIVLSIAFDVRFKASSQEPNN